MPAVLVIEDESNIRQFVALNLIARGYEVVEAASAEEGLEQLWEHTFAVVILDIKLPMMSGWDLLRQVAADPTLPNIPVIILTAYFSSNNPNEQGYPNIVGLLNKPISTSNLISAVKQAIG